MHAVRSTRPELAPDLEQAGFTVRGEILYDATATDVLPPEAVAALRDGGLDAAMFFSPRSAAVFAGLVRKAGLESACGRIEALCISQATADALGTLAIRAVRIAKRPNQAAMLTLAG